MMLSELAGRHTGDADHADDFCSLTSGTTIMDGSRAAWQAPVFR